MLKQKHYSAFDQASTQNITIYLYRMSGNEETFIIGNYDGEKRKREILEQFQKMLDEASKDIAKFREELLKGPREGGLSFTSVVSCITQVY